MRVVVAELADLEVNVWRLAFGVWRLAFGVRRSAFGVRRSAFERSAFGIWGFKNNAALILFVMMYVSCG